MPRTRLEVYVPMEYCAIGPPNPAARPGAVFGRLGLSHHDAEILHLAAGVCELVVESGEASGCAGACVLFLRGPLRAGRERGDDGPLGQRVSQDRRPAPRQRGATVAAHVVLSGRATD